MAVAICCAVDRKCNAFLRSDADVDSPSLIEFDELMRPPGRSLGASETSA